MKISEKILLLFSRNPLVGDYLEARPARNLDGIFISLSQLFPDLADNIRDKRVIDFGCGEGYQALALAKNGAGQVLGMDINHKTLSSARVLSREYGLDHKVQFVDPTENTNSDLFDSIISINSMEHYTDPIGVINTMKSSIIQGGYIYISFGPPWYAPYGSHMHFFTKLPWINIIFSEKTVMRVRNNFRNDGAIGYEQVESGLNRMSIAKFEKLIADSGLKIIYRRYDCIKGLNFLGKIPLVRELFINRVICILAK